MQKNEAVYTIQYMSSVWRAHEVGAGRVVHNTVCSNGKKQEKKKKKKPVCIRARVALGCRLCGRVGWQCDSNSGTEGWNDLSSNAMDYKAVCIRLKKLCDYR